ncbi:MAG: hypothetical protein AAF267_24690, partial [Deinococcota bacterium]
MKKLLLLLLLSCVPASAQELPFVEVGGTYRVIGGIFPSVYLEDQDYVVIVLEVAGKWIRVDVDYVDGPAWLNTDRLSLIANTDDIALTPEEEVRIKARQCLRELLTAQEIYLTDNGTYTTHDVLFESFFPDVCEEVQVNTDYADEREYLFTVTEGLNRPLRASSSRGVFIDEDSEKIQACLKELATLAQTYYIDLSVYPEDHEAIFEYFEKPSICEDVEVTTVSIVETDYY